LNCVDVAARAFRQVDFAVLACRALPAVILRIPAALPACLAPAFLASPERSCSVCLITACRACRAIKRSYRSDKKYRFPSSAHVSVCSRHQSTCLSTKRIPCALAYFWHTTARFGRFVRFVRIDDKQLIDSKNSTCVQPVLRHLSSLFIDLRSSAPGLAFSQAFFCFALCAPHLPHWGPRRRPLLPLLG
jgi:hypothetical protein